VPLIVSATYGSFRYNTELVDPTGYSAVYGHGADSVNCRESDGAEKWIGVALRETPWPGKKSEIVLDTRISGVAATATV
jgi:hypothetical protein